MAADERRLTPINADNNALLIRVYRRLSAAKYFLQGF
jgi:hypothetical protein